MDIIGAELTEEAEGAGGKWGKGCRAILQSSPLPLCSWGRMAELRLLVEF